MCLRRAGSSAGAFAAALDTGDLVRDLTAAAAAAALDHALVGLHDDGHGLALLLLPVGAAAAAAAAAAERRRRSQLLLRRLLLLQGGCRRPHAHGCSRRGTSGRGLHLVLVVVEPHLLVLVQVPGVAAEAAGTEDGAHAVEMEAKARWRTLIMVRGRDYFVQKETVVEQ